MWLTSQSAASSSIFRRCPGANSPKRMRRRRSSATRVAVVVESSPLIELPLLRLESDRLDELFVAYRVGAQQRVELLGRARHDIGPHRHELLADVGLPERLDDVAVELVE